MLRNYFTVAVRNLMRHRVYTAINVGGLAVGIACALLILLFVRDELAYDRHHERADRIYRMTTVVGSTTHFAGAAAAMMEVMKREFPEVEEAARLRPSDAVVRFGERRFHEQRFWFADSTVFDVFTLPLTAGDPRTALDAPNRVLLSESAARRYFGEEEALGRTLLVDGDEPYRVTGVFRDLPSTSSVRFDFLAAMASIPSSRNPDWLSNLEAFKTYLLLRPGASGEALQAKLPALVARNVGEVLRSLGADFELRLQPLTEVHLRSAVPGEPGGSAGSVYLFSTVALLILLVACINFMNLSTARAAERAREVGMRKVLGARRRQLVQQFMAESLVITACALALALVLAEGLLPVLNGITGRTLRLDPFGDLPLLGFLLVLAPAVALVAGSYPALFLSRQAAGAVLKGRFTAGVGGGRLRQALVVTQFAVSIALVAGTLVVSRQLEFARGERLGFHRERTVAIPIHLDGELWQRRDAFKTEVLAHPAVESATGTDHFPGGPADDLVFRPEGAAMDRSVHLWVHRVDFDYLETLGMEIAVGRGFSAEMPTDSGAVLLNETAARLIGWEDPLGRGLGYLSSADDSDTDYLPVIGVVKDFHFESFREEIRPLVFLIDPRPEYLLVRLRPGDPAPALRALEEAWARFAANAPFEYRFLEGYFDELYRSEEQLGRIFTGFAILTIFIACLGLFGLASYTTQRRTKEIGVRKALGATVPGLVLLLSKEFGRLVLVGFLIAGPVAYLLADRWLDRFAYRVPLGAGVFLLAGALAAVVALGTVSYQSVRAARADPVKSLRYE